MHLPDTSVGADLDASLAELKGRGVDIIRVLWSDLHGVARGKDVTIDDFVSLLDGGLGFCQTLMLTDLSAQAVTDASVVDEIFPDAKLAPQTETFRLVPWEPGVAVVIAGLRDEHGDDPLAVSPRDALVRVTQRLADRGFTGVIGPELEFYLFRGERTASGGFDPYLTRDTAGYVVGIAADPRQVLTRILRQCRAFGLGVFAANHEFSGGQFEVNQTHSEALDAADRAFLLKHAVKEVAATEQLHATFMGKPVEDRAGSGFHMHVSLVDAGGRNLFADGSAPDGLSPLALSFLAGILDATPALTGILNPTINAFKRLTPGSLAPTMASWGLDDRTAAVRVPPERGRGTRLELRVGDASANPYLAFAAVLAAGMDGVARGATPADCVDSGRTGHPLPTSLRDAIDALDRSEMLREALGSGLVDSFCALKRQELERFDRAVTDWEVREYGWAL